MNAEPLYELTINETSLAVTPYALCVVAALALGLIMLAWRCGRAGLREDTAGAVGLLGIPLGLIGARVFYVACNFNFFHYLLEDEGGLLLGFRLWMGGFGLWGAVAGGVLAALLAAKITKQPVSSLLDALAAPAALIIALCRFAEYFCGQGYGLNVNIDFFQRFPFAVINKDGIWHWAVFVLEGLAALAMMAVLLRKERPAGNSARLFLILYSACQIVLESMRGDAYLTLHNNNFVRISQVISLLVLIGLMIGGTLRWAWYPYERRVRIWVLILCWTGLIILAGAVVALEFSMDNKISWLRFLSKEGAHLVMAVCAAGMGTAAYWTVFSTERN